MNSTSRTIAWNAAGGGFDIQNASNTFTVTRNLAGGGPLGKTGPGALLLAGCNSYSGATTVYAGTLAVNGALSGAGQVTVSGGVLSGSGAVGNTFIQSGGTLSPGYNAVAGTLSAASLTLDNGSVLNYTLGGEAGCNSFVNATNGLVLPTSGVTVNLADGGSLGIGTYPLMATAP